MKHLLLVLTFVLSVFMSFAENYENEKKTNDKETIENQILNFDSVTVNPIAEESENIIVIHPLVEMYFTLSCGISGWIGADTYAEMWQLYCQAEAMHCAYMD